MVLQEEFLPSCTVMSREINIVRQATEGKKHARLLFGGSEVYVIFTLIWSNN